MMSSTEIVDLLPLLNLKDATEIAQRNTSKMLSKLENFERTLFDLNRKTMVIQKVLPILNIKFYQSNFIQTTKN